MPRLNEWKPSDPIQIIVIGPYKGGKTWFAYTFPRVVSFDFDKGVATARNPEFVKRYGVRDIFYEQFDETKKGKGGIALAHNAFDDSCRFYDEWMKPKGKWKGYDVGVDMFDTWVVDSGTTLSDFAMNKAAIVLGASNPPLSHTQKNALTTGLLIPKKQDYGAERSLVEQFIDMVKGSGKNVVFICHEKIVTDDEQTPTDIGPLLTGKSFQAVPNKFDEVYFLRNQRQGSEMKRYLQTEPDGLRRAGSRYGIPTGIEPSYDVLKGHIDRIHAEQQKQVAQPEVVVAGAVGVSSTLVTGVK
jgi:hypothetical protein